MSVPEGRNRNVIRNDRFREQSLSKAVVYFYLHAKMLHEYKYFWTPLYDIRSVVLLVGKFL